MATNQTKEPLAFIDIWEYMEERDKFFIAQRLKVELGALPLIRISSFFNQIRIREIYLGERKIWFLNIADNVVARRIKLAMAKTRSRQPQWASSFKNGKHPKPQNDRLKGKYAKRR